MNNVDSETIRAATDLISRADTWGPASTNFMLLMLLIAICGLFVWYVVGRLTKVVDNNTEAIERSVQSYERMLKELSMIFGREFDDIKKKQNDIHTDVKELLITSRIGHKINKGVVEEGEH